MAREIYHIYDKIFKKILTLSTKSVIHLINGLFGTDYPPDSTITYNWTEFEDKELRTVLADTILTINGVHSYHIEAQITEDKEIVFRMFEYGYGHADRTRVNTKDGMYLHFPEPKIIYLYSENDVPEEYVLHLDFGTQGTFEYRVSTVKFMKMSAEELNERGMVILIPFLLLKLRKIIKKERSKENLEALKSLICNDIIGSIEQNLEAGNISGEDAQKLKSYTHKLYEHIYAHYDELEEISDMTDESLILDVDILIKELEEKISKEVEAKYKDANAILQEKDIELQEKDAELQEKDAELREKDALIAELQKQIEMLQKS